MIRLLRSLVLLVLLAAAAPAHAALKVLATTADWAALTRELGGDKVDVYGATTAFQDVHRVDAKPSLVARARSADLVVLSGADLEIGWLPVLLQESGNPRVQVGQPGYFDASSNCAAARGTLNRRPIDGRRAPAGQSPRPSRSRTTSRRSRRRSRRAWASSTRRTHRTLRVAERISSHAGGRR